MKHLNEDQLILHYYGEAPDPAAIESHLFSCADCRAGFEGLRRVLAAANALQVPERRESYGSEVWQRLRPRLSERRRWDWKPTFHVSRWAWASLITAMLVAAFFLGRSGREPRFLWRSSRRGRCANASSWRLLRILWKAPRG